MRVVEKSPHACTEGVVLDVDLTLYGGAAGRQYIADSDRRAVHLAGIELGWNCSGSYTSWERMQAIRQQYAEELGVERTTISATLIRKLGFPADRWNQLRVKVYTPEEYLQPDPRMVQCLERLSTTHRVALASNSPSRTVRRVLKVLGAENLPVPIIGPDQAPESKPSKRYYEYVAQQLGLDPSRCVSIGDRWEADCLPAIEAGMNAIQVQGPEDVYQLSELIRLHDGPFDSAAYLQEIYQPGKIVVLAVTGQAGVGKTTLAHLASGASLPFAVERLPLDCFFRLSSPARKQWLSEGASISPQEYAQRSNQINWWDYSKLKIALQMVRNQRVLQLEGVYNQADAGNMTGIVNITFPPQGGILLVEGVGLAHLPQLFDHMLALHAPTSLRRQRLAERETHRTPEERARRFELTEKFEVPYFGQNGRAIALHLDNTGQIPALLRQMPTLY